MSETGNRIKKRRQQLKLTMEELATAVGYSSATRKTIIFNIENGKNDILLSRLPVFANVLKTNIYYLLGMTENDSLTDQEVISLMDQTSTENIENIVSDKV